MSYLPRQIPFLVHRDDFFYFNIFIYLFLNSTRQQYTKSCPCLAKLWERRKIRLILLEDASCKTIASIAFHSFLQCNVMCSAFIPQVGLAAIRGPNFFHSILSLAKLIAVFMSLPFRSPRIDSCVGLTFPLDCLPCLLDFPFGSSSPAATGGILWRALARITGREICVWMLM